VLLTYAAVSMAAIPISLGTMKHDNAPVHTSDQNAGTTTQSESSQPKEPSSAGQGERPSFGAALATLVLIGLASPFLGLADGPSGVLMLIILFVGMQFAWKMTAGRPAVQIAGPFELSKSASA
jgi:hypothetical protein